MLTLIRNVDLFAPEPQGRRDVLVAGEHILEIADQITLAGAAVTELDASGLAMWPGFVDALTHPAGGGGEGGFGNRTAELGAESFTAAGITSPVGALGTDAVTRSLDVLYGQIMHLRAHGVAAFMYGGSYRLPVATLTGDVVRDMVLVEPLIGFGEVAIADHRGSQPSAAELRRLAADTRLGGTISGKTGTVMLHVGDGTDRLGVMRAALEGSDLAPQCFYPTHCNRSQSLLAEAFEHARSGGWIDFTAATTPEFIAAGEIPVLSALGQGVAEGVPLTQMTVSSDAGGSLPHYQEGVLLSSRAATPNVLLELAFEAARNQPSLLPVLLAAITRNPADALGLKTRGRLETGCHADLLLVDPANQSLEAVMCQGRWLGGNTLL